MKKPECPFCGLPVERPKEPAARRQGEMPVGSCSCGAVYAYDVTGHNLGSAFIEALVFACNMDWNLAWLLLPEEDYQENLVENYDSESHFIIPSGSYEGRRVSGALYFIRLHNDIREATGEGVREKLARATPISIKQPNPKRSGDKGFTKKEVEDLVREYKVSALLGIATQDRRIIRDLQRLLCSSEELVRLRAADMLGKASAVIAQKDPGTVSSLMQKLFNSITDSGASGWGAIDAIGEIIGNSPDLYMGYVPALYQFIEDEELKPKIIRAIGRAAQARPDLIRRSVFRLSAFLHDPSPETRGYAALLFGILSVPEAKNDLEAIRDDSHQVILYQNGDITQKSVGEIASDSLQKIKISVSAP
ncbi:MAG: DVU0298 family protein [Eubacteriales bacterium]